jgi:hypothetical protein
MTKKTRLSILLLFSVFLTGCQLQNTQFQKTTLSCKFRLATAGNILNPKYYSPDSGPEGFVNYHSYIDFSRSYILFHTNGSIENVCVLTGYIDASKSGTYTGSQPVQGNTMQVIYSNADSVTFTWLNYYEVYATDIFDLPGLGVTSVTALYHSTDIWY